VTKLLAGRKPPASEDVKVWFNLPTPRLTGGNGCVYVLSYFQ